MGVQVLPGAPTNSVVAQPGRGTRSRTCSVEVQLLSALPNRVRSSSRASGCFARRRLGVRISPDPPRGRRLAARTPRLQRGGRRFESGRPYQHQQLLRGAEAAPGSHKSRDPGSIPGHATKARSSRRIRAPAPHAGYGGSNPPRATTHPSPGGSSAARAAA